MLQFHGSAEFYCMGIGIIVLALNCLILTVDIKRKEEELRKLKEKKT